ncbi:hypothetical protein D3C71_1262920 [compost metagenome]
MDHKFSLLDQVIAGDLRIREEVSWVDHIIGRQPPATQSILVMPHFIYRCAQLHPVMLGQLQLLTELVMAQDEVHHVLDLDRIQIIR